jgi:hypothetical protein
MTQLEGEGGAYSGHDQLRVFLGEVNEAWERFHITVHAARRRDRLTLIHVTISARGRTSGAEGSTEAYSLVELCEHGKTVWAKIFSDLDEALGAASRRAGTA